METFSITAADETPQGTVRAHEVSVNTYGYYEPTCNVLSCAVACRTRYQVTSDTGC